MTASFKRSTIPSLVVRLLGAGKAATLVRTSPQEGRQIFHGAAGVWSVLPGRSSSPSLSRQSCTSNNLLLSNDGWYSLSAKRSPESGTRLVSHEHTRVSPRLSLMSQTVNRSSHPTPTLLYIESQKPLKRSSTRTRISPAFYSITIFGPPAQRSQGAIGIPPKNSLPGRTSTQAQPPLALFPLANIRGHQDRP